MLLLAWKNLWRNRRRSIITLVSIVFASALITLSRFFTYGTHEETLQQALGLNTGYVQVAAYGWPVEKTLDRALDVDERLLEKISSVEGVEVLSPRIESAALAAFGSSSRFVTIMAAMPERERGVTRLQKRIVKGEFLHDSTEEAVRESNGISVYEAVAGHTLVREMGLEPGDEFALTTTQFDGSIGAILVQLRGVLKADDKLIDENGIYISLAAGKRLFAPSVGAAEGIERYTSIAIGVENHKTGQRVYKHLSKIFPEPEGEEGIAPEQSDIYDPVAYSWREINQAVVQYIVLDQLGLEFFLVFVILILAFGVLNTVEMSLYERRKEFGVLLAIGMHHRELYLTLFYEVTIILLLGMSMGTILGTLGSYYLQYHPIVLTGENAEVMVQAGAAPVMRAIVTWQEMYIAWLSLMLPALLFSWLGIRRVTRLQPAQIINTL